MIQEKYYTEKEGRDPSVYLGIDTSEIPIELFKGIYSEARTLYTDDVYSGIQIWVAEDEKSVSLVTTNPNLYITLEDIKNTDIWYKIGHVLGEYGSQFMSIEESNKNSPFNTLLERYKSGETGLLEYSNVKYNDKGEYMKVYKSFDTRPHPEEEDIRGTLLRHINFVYSEDPTITMMERTSKVKTNSENIKLLKELLVKPQFEIMKANGMLPDSLDQEFSKLSFTQVHFPPYGALEFIEDESVEDFIVTKK